MCKIASYSSSFQAQKDNPQAACECRESASLLISLAWRTRTEHSISVAGKSGAVPPSVASTRILQGRISVLVLSLLFPASFE